MWQIFILIVLIFWRFLFNTDCVHYFRNIQLHVCWFVKLLDPPHHSKDRVKCKISKKKMSVTSSITASRDWEVPSTNIVFRGRLCLVTITRRDGTLMDASSISEKDIVEICIKKGHTCPLGVLCYSATESVILFHTTDELKHVSHGIVKLMELQDEAIMVKAMAPLEAHITAYITVWHLKPSKGDGSCTHLPNKLPQVGEHHTIFKQNLVTLSTTSCRRSWRNYTKKLHNAE